MLVYTMVYVFVYNPIASVSLYLIAKYESVFGSIVL